MGLMEMNALRLEKVTLRINGDPLFAPLNLSIEPGEVTSVMGPSGSGKSSLLKFLCGILADDIAAAGSVRIGNDDLTALEPQSRRLGLLFQDPLLFPHLNITGNVLFGLRNGGSRHERRQRAAEALASVGLDQFGARDPATLSGGQQARVALLRVLLAEPRALLLDEPFRSLDDENRQRTRELIFTEAKKRGLPTLLVTHDYDDVAAAGGPVIELQSQG